MKLVAALAVAVTLALPASSGASRERVLGVDSTVLGMRLAWYDPATLTRLPGKTVSLANHGGSWSFSPNGTRLAVASGGATDLRLLDVKRMRVLGTVRLRNRFSAEQLVWPSAKRLLSVAGNLVTVLDPTHMRVVRRTHLPGVMRNAVPWADGLVVLLGKDGNGFAPAALAVVNSEGRVRSIGLDRISIGFLRQGDTYEVREAGLAVDAATGSGFVVGGDGIVAEVNLRTPAVAYHGSTRSLMKELPGPQWNARWLGNGLLAVAGIDGLERKGLRIVDTRDWTTRVVDADSVFVTVAGDMLIGSAPFCCPSDYAVYGIDGSPRYRLGFEFGEDMHIAGRFGYVCHGNTLTRVVQLSTGATLRQFQSGQAPVCATLLTGRTSAQ